MHITHKQKININEMSYHRKYTYTVHCFLYTQACYCLSTHLTSNWLSLKIIKQTISPLLTALNVFRLT